MMFQMLTKSPVHQQAIINNLDDFYAMIKSRKLQKNAFATSGQQITFVNKFQIIINELDQWFKEKQKEKNLELQKSLLLRQDQLKLREEDFVKMLAQCKTNINMPLLQMMQKTKKSFLYQQNYQIIACQFSEMISKNKTLNLIQQKLKANNCQVVQILDSINRLIEDGTQNKKIIQIYEGAISQFNNFPSKVQLSNFYALKNKNKQSFIEANISKMSELFKALTKTKDLSLNRNINIYKINCFQQSSHTQIKYNNNNNNNLEQHLGKPAADIIKQNQELRQSKVQHELATETLRDLASYNFGKIQQNICNLDRAAQQNFLKIKKEMQLSATTVKDIYKRIVAILIRSNFMNELQLQHEAVQNSWNTNLLLATNQKRLTDIQNMFVIYDGLVIQLRQIEIVKKRCNKNRKYILKDEINLCISAIRQLQSKDKRLLDLFPAKEHKQNVILSQKHTTQNNNLNTMNQYSQYMEVYMVNWIQLCKTILEPEEQTEDRSWLQYQFYASKFDQIVSEIKKIKINLNLQQQKNILLSQQLEQIYAKFETTKVLISTLQSACHINPLQNQGIQKSQNYKYIFDQLGKEQTLRQGLKYRNDVLIQQKRQMQKQINQLAIRYRQLQLESNYLRNNVKLMQKDKANLNVKIAFNKSQINNLQQSKNLVEINVIKLENDLQAAKKTIKHLADNRLNSVNNTIKDFSKHYNQGQQLKIEYTKMKQQMVQWKITYLELKSQQSEKLQILAQLQSENFRLIDECKRIRGQNQSLAQESEQQNNQIAKLKIQISKCMQQLSHLKQMQYRLQQQAQKIQKIGDQIEQYTNRLYCQKQNCICARQQILITANSLLKSIAHINNKQCSINEKINSDIQKKKIQIQPISPIKDCEGTLSKQKITVALKKENTMDINTQLTEAVSRCQYYKQLLNKKDTQRQNILLAVHQLLEQNHELSERYKSLKFSNQKNVQIIKLQTNKEIYDLRLYVVKMEEEKFFLIKQKEGIMLNMKEIESGSEQSSMFNPDPTQSKNYCPQTLQNIEQNNQLSYVYAFDHESYHYLFDFFHFDKKNQYLIQIHKNYNLGSGIVERQLNNNYQQTLFEG